MIDFDGNCILCGHDKFRLSKLTTKNGIITFNLRCIECAEVHNIYCPRPVVHNVNC